MQEVFAHAGRNPLEVVVPPCQSGDLPLPATVGGVVSVVQAFSGATVLITGATGYIGSLVMENLLRMVPNVKRIYVIVRDKKGLSAEARINKLLQRSMFHLLKQGGVVQPETRAKISVLSGDLLQGGCGLSMADMRRLCEEVDFVIHSAASISFIAHIHSLLAQNYHATQKVADLARAMKKLRAFVHVSTAYANCDQPKATHVREQIYPLRDMSGQAINPEALAGELASLPYKEADVRARQVLAAVNMPSCYMFSKRLSELLLASLHGRHLPVVIVRPSLVGSIARLPHPGYTGNSAGPTAIALAYSTGIATYTCHQEYHVYDVIPGDVCTAVILAAAAAMAQLEKEPKEPLVVHACSSTTNPETLFGWWLMAHKYWTPNKPPVRLFLGEYPQPDAAVRPVGMPETSLRFRIYTFIQDLKMRLVVLLLRLLGYTYYAVKLWEGWLTWKVYNRAGLDFNLFFCARRAQELEERLPASERGMLRTVWRRGRDEWDPYLATHFNAIRAMYFGQAKHAIPLPQGKEVEALAAPPPPASHHELPCGQ